MRFEGLRHGLLFNVIYPQRTWGIPHSCFHLLQIWEWLLYQPARVGYVGDGFGWAMTVKKSMALVLRSAGGGMLHLGYLWKKRVGHPRSSWLTKAHTSRRP